MLTHISIVIPIYNSGDIIEHTVQSIIRTLDPLNVEYEILLRDDGSYNGIRSILERLNTKYSQVQCTFSQQNKGLGDTLQWLFDHARGEKIVYCDCDLPFGAEIIPTLIEKLQNCDIAVASRYSDRSNQIRFIRKIFSRLYYNFCKILFDIPVQDIGSGSIAIKNVVLRKLELKSKGFGIHAEIYCKALRQNLLIEEIPAKFDRGKQGSFSIWKHGPKVILETIQLKKELKNI